MLVESALAVRRRPPANLVPTDEEFFADAFSYVTNDVYLKTLGSVWLSPNSVVYRNGVLLQETLATINQWSYYRLKHLAKKLLTGKRVSLDASKSYLLVTDAWSSGHFHWFMEVLPRIWTIRNRSKDFVLLLPDTPYVRSIGLESLGLLKLNFEDVVLMKEMDFYRINDLHFVSRVTNPGQTHDQIMTEINAAFVGAKIGGQDKIYISRAKARVRKVLNEGELTPLLKNYGFEILCGEDFTLAEQIEIFVSCSTLMGIHGAGLTNCAFMKPGGNVVELRKRERNCGYRHLAGSLNHEYYYYNGEPDSDASPD
ncbi:MAG: glycosyltransferase family 61 protein [Acidobacteria bacterium]|nr:glycosyltransferase family 61 protein [Acidobacteriota bacterium]